MFLFFTTSCSSVYAEQNLLNFWWSNIKIFIACSITSSIPLWRLLLHYPTLSFLFQCSFALRHWIFLNAYFPSKLFLLSNRRLNLKRLPLAFFLLLFFFLFVVHLVKIVWIEYRNIAQVAKISVMKKVGGHWEELKISNRSIKFYFFSLVFNWQFLHK